MNDFFIKNDNILRQVKFKLDIIDDNYTDDDLNKIDELVIDLDTQSEYDFSFIEELILFKNLKSLTIRNGFIYNDDYKIFSKLEKLESISFFNCEFENANLIASLNLKELVLSKCNINDYLFINTFDCLEKLTINSSDIYINKLNRLVGIQYLDISYCNIIDMDQINISSLIKLRIDHTNIKYLDFIEKLDNLKYISIDEEQYNSNRTIIDKVTHSGVIVLDEDMVEFGGE